MTFAGISISDPDSLDAAADAYESYTNALRANGLGSYDAYIDTLVEQLDAESADTEPDDEYVTASLRRIEAPYDDEPTPPASPTALPLPCRECSKGVKRYSTGGRLSDWIEERCTACAGTGFAPVPCFVCSGSGTCDRYPASPCWACAGSGRDELTGEAGEAPPPTAPAARVPSGRFDRQEHCRRIGQSGGMTTLERYGSAHFRRIGRAGYRVTVANHGAPYTAGLLAAKGWTPRTPDLLADLAAGRELADLDRLAA